MPMDRLLTTNEAAVRLGVNPYTVREWLREGKITGYKIAWTRWRIKESDLEAFEAKRKTGSRRTSG